ncbi:uncharacterized protein LOC117651419 isoform X2 [Thrips palmi]|uniref:Uncharacterized protein LOC117651419 isoform X2 n=1 Tax=Thrips palmi TaxID=161013 RepID=A0A6P9A255_THRPL|nr:uncharacterized protein LOC117651419 isoform X2 [Thrips palmi]
MRALSMVVCALLALQVERCHSSASEEAIQKVKKCAEEQNIKADDIRPFFEEKEISKNAKCFFKCMMTTFNLLREDGTIYAEPAIMECLKDGVRPAFYPNRSMDLNFERLVRK